jgi:uncharacterized OB-fold protein
MEFIIDGWMELADDGRVRLLGQRCEACGTVYFPKSARCKRCSSAHTVEQALGPEAELHSYTIDRLGTFRGEPHLVGQVQFAEGAFAQGYIDGPVDALPMIGSTVDLVPFEVSVEGEPTITYAFKPRER